MSDRDLVRALAEHDRAGAPRFSVRAIPRRVSSLPAAAAVAAGVLLALAVVGRHDDSTSIAIARAQALSAWSAPTDELLESYDATLSGAAPNLTLSSINLPSTRSLP